MKVLMILTLILVCILSVKADEGWWSLARTSGGSLYSKTEHPDIALEKEVLIYEGDGKCNVNFLFKNTANKNITFKVGFPVQIILPLTFDRIDPSKILLDKIYGKEFGLRSPGQDTVDPQKLQKKVRQVSSFDSFQDLNTIFENEGNKWVDIAIAQDGNNIDIDSVLIESQLTNDNSVIIQFHFLHQLSMEAKSVSNVKVKYSSNSAVMASPGEPYRVHFIIWSYILGTGKTWKGSIKNIYLLVPEHLNPKLPQPFSCVGNYKKNSVFIAKDYEPLEEDRIDIRYMNFAFNDYDSTIRGLLVEDSSSSLIKSIDKPKKPAQNFVILKNASSYLVQKTWARSFQICNIPQEDPIWKALFKPSYYKHFYETVGSHELSYVSEHVPVTFKNTDFGPLSLFDGIPETAWCEGIKGDGIGEWIEFELTEDIGGLSIYNGFRKGRWYHQNWDSLSISNLMTKYIDNNRVKLFEFLSCDGKIDQRIELGDIPSRQDFDIYLPSGIYKIYIREIYKGKKWEDTCLGEIVFHSASAMPVIEKENYLSKILKLSTL